MAAQTTSTETSSKSAAPRVRGPRPGTNLGQWKISGKEPLNHNEEFKSEGNPLDVRERIIDTYSKQGFDSIPTDDVHGRFRWMGLYTQRKQGVDGASTSSWMRSPCRTSTS